MPIRLPNPQPWVHNAEMSTHEAETLIPVDSFEMRLAIARFHAGNLSAAEAALRVGVSGQTWRNWEAGTSPGAKKPSMLAYIAEQLGVDFQWLRDGGPLNGGGDPEGGGASIGGIGLDSGDPTTTQEYVALSVAA